MIGVVAAFVILAVVVGGLGAIVVVRQFGRLQPPATTVRPVITPPAHPGRITLPLALTASNSSGPVVTPEQAVAIVKAWWPLGEQALGANDIVLTDALETGPAAEFNDAVSRDNLVRGGNLRVSRPLRDVAVRVPRSDGYPASFLAFVLTTVYGTDPAGEHAGTPYMETLVFVRSGATSQWKVALDTGAVIRSGWPLFAPTLLSGTSFEAPAQGSFGYEPESVPKMYADFDQRFLDEGAHPSGFPFLDGYWTRDYMAKAVQDDRASVTRTGVHQKTTYSVDVGADGLYQFAIEEGRDFECFTLRYALDSTIPGRLEYQDPARNNWGGPLPPGVYSSITTRGLRQTCAQVGRSGETWVTIIGGNGGQVSVTGVRP